MNVIISFKPVILGTCMDESDIVCRTKTNPDRDLMWVESRFSNNMVFRPVRDEMNVDLSYFSTHILCLWHIDLTLCNLSDQVCHPFEIPSCCEFDKSVIGNVTL